MKNVCDEPNGDAGTTGSLVSELRSEASSSTTVPSLQSSSVSLRNLFEDSNKSRHELKILCRIIAAHHTTPERNSMLTFRVDGVLQRFRVLDNVHIGNHVRCLVVYPETADIQGTIFAFNWFSPQNVWDYCALGIHWARRTRIDEQFRLCNAFSMDLAERFYQHPDVVRILGAVAASAVAFIDPSSFLRSSSESSPVPVIRSGEAPAPRTDLQTLHVTGFSMGASIAHAFAVLLKEKERLTHPVHCVGFGSPRPGNTELSQWFHRHLTPDSLNVILVRQEGDETARRELGRQHGTVITALLGDVCSGQEEAKQHYTPKTALGKASQSTDTNKNLTYDPVTLSPSVMQGFDLHPNGHILFYTESSHDSAIFRPLTSAECHRIREEDRFKGPTTVTSSLLNILKHRSPYPASLARVMNELHSILKYYTALSSNMCDGPIDWGT